MAFPYSEGSDYVESLLSAKLLFMESVFSWYAVYTAARAEKKVKERLDQIGIENYLPLRTEYRVWSDRKKKVMGHRTKRFFQWSGKMGERL